jgi:hypothetical protein
LIVLYWAASVTVGFALIYLPALPHSFTFIAGLHPQRYGSFQGAFVISLASLMTLSSGVYPASLWIQLLMGIESVCGFGLLTASISWMLSIYPVLEHRRSLAQQATLLHFAEEKGIGYLRQMSDAELQQILFGLAAQVATCRNELTQFPITYYFHEEETETALSGMLWYLADIAEENAFRSGAAAMAATSLGGAIEQYLKYVARVFLRRKFTDRREILRAFAEDHLRTVVAEPHPTRKAA